MKPVFYVLGAVAALFGAVCFFSSQPEWFAGGNIVAFVGMVAGIILLFGGLFTEEWGTKPVQEPSAQPEKGPVLAEKMGKRRKRRVEARKEDEHAV